MAKIKHLIFDMGNVLMRYDPEVPLREYVSSEEARDLIRKELFQGPEWVERDRGTISIEEMYERVAKRIPEQYHEALKKCVYGWDICMEPLEKSVKLCEDARKWGYQTYVLSNAGSEEFYRYFPKFSFDNFFYNSSVIGKIVHVSTSFYSFRGFCCRSAVPLFRPLRPTFGAHLLLATASAFSSMVVAKIA